uniref:Putative ovule protein n=1 Tax=Solanum chacoense TaxID=4108 RepID=A0A0V0H248_SOLCH
MKKGCVVSLYGLGQFSPCELTFGVELRPKIHFFTIVKKQKYFDTSSILIWFLCAGVTAPEVLNFTANVNLFGFLGESL